MSNHLDHAVTHLLTRAATMTRVTDGAPAGEAVLALAEIMRTPIDATPQEQIKNLATLNACLMIHLHRSHRCQLAEPSPSSPPS
jgi:hypothetical protein